MYAILKMNLIKSGGGTGPMKPGNRKCGANSCGGRPKDEAEHFEVFHLIAPMGFFHFKGKREDNEAIFYI